MRGHLSTLMGVLLLTGTACDRGRQAAPATSLGGPQPTLVRPRPIRPLPPAALADSVPAVRRRLIPLNAAGGGLAVVGGTVSYSSYKVAKLVALPVTRGGVPAGAARDIAILRPHSIEILDHDLLLPTTTHNDVLSMVSAGSGRSKSEIISGYFGEGMRTDQAVRLRVAEQEMVLNRVSTVRPALGQPSSPWLIGENVGANVTSRAALPAANEAKFMAEAVIPKGTLFLEGYAAPLNGKPGGLVQVFAATRDAKIVSATTFENLAGKAGGRPLVSAAAGEELAVASKWLRAIKWVGVAVTAAGAATIAYNYYESRDLLDDVEPKASDRVRKALENAAAGQQAP